MIEKILLALLYFGIVVVLGCIVYLLSQRAIQELNKKEESERLNKNLEALAARRL